MKILSEAKLPGREQLRILHWHAPEKAPRKYVDYISASFGMDHPHNNLYTIGIWNGYFNDAVNAVYYPEVVDHCFFAEADGGGGGGRRFLPDVKSVFFRVFSIFLLCNNLIREIQ